MLRREQVRSLRQGKRRVTDLVLAAADSCGQSGFGCQDEGQRGAASSRKSPGVESIDPARRRQSAGRPTRRSRPPFFHDP